MSNIIKRKARRVSHRMRPRETPAESQPLSPTRSSSRAPRLRGIVKAKGKIPVKTRTGKVVKQESRADMHAASVEILGPWFLATVVDKTVFHVENGGQTKSENNQ